MSENQSNVKVAVVIGLLLTIADFTAGFLAYPYLPEKVPTHWNISGEVNGWGSAWQGAFLLPLIMLGVFLLLVFIPKIDPKRKSYAQMSKPYSAIVLVTMLFLSVMYFGTLGASLGYFKTVPSLVYLGVGALFMVIGNYMGKLKHNYFMGIRTPWTLSSEEVWYKTHRMAGPFWVIGGILFMVSSLLPTGFMTPIILIIIFGLAVIPVGYSYVIFRRLEREK
ncbi:MAG: Immunity protein SdpI [Candidatus Dichloromethanomonas elyunquensis]|nr:MAG: Immunity protein SdpI [Candidatus Dichloromethanomonas elyunquensis]